MCSLAIDMYNPPYIMEHIAMIANRNFFDIRLIFYRELLPSLILFNLGITYIRLRMLNQRIHA
jgi:hypothetical protein